MSELWEVLTEHLPEFSSGFFVTLRLVAISFVIAMAVGTLIAALRVAPVKWLNVVGGIYVEIFRNIPLLVLLFIAYAGLRRAGVPISPWVAGTASLGLYTAAYIAEALRSGVFAVGRGQIDAALSLGLTLPEDAAPDRASAGVSDRDPGAGQPRDRDGQELGGRRCLAAGPPRPAQAVAPARNRRRFRPPRSSSGRRSAT